MTNTKMGICYLSFYSVQGEKTVFRINRKKTSIKPILCVQKISYAYFIVFLYTLNPLFLTADYFGAKNNAFFSRKYCQVLNIRLDSVSAFIKFCF